MDEAVAQLQQRLEARGFEPLGVIAHSEILSKAVGAELRDTKLILFQDASNDGALMTQSRTYGIDLPQKLLVWEDEQGTVQLTFNNGDYLARRHGIARSNLMDVDNNLRMLATSVGATSAENKLAFTGARLTGVLVLVAGTLIGAGLALVVVSERRLVAHLLVAAFIATSLVPSTISDAEAQESEGLVTVTSQYTLDEALGIIRASAEEKGLRAGITVTHAADDLPPTVLLTFGQPAMNAELLKASQLYGVDLPQKIMIWEDDDGTTQITYNDPVYLGRRHGVVSPTVRQLQTLLSAVVADGIGR